MRTTNQRGKTSLSLDAEAHVNHSSVVSRGRQHPSFLYTRCNESSGSPRHHGVCNGYATADLPWQPPQRSRCSFDILEPAGGTLTMCGKMFEKKVEKGKV